MGMIRPQIREAYRRKQDVAQRQEISVNGGATERVEAGPASAAQRSEIRSDERGKPTLPEKPKCVSS